MNILFLMFKDVHKQMISPTNVELPAGMVNDFQWGFCLMAS